MARLKVSVYAVEDKTFFVFYSIGSQHETYLQTSAANLPLIQSYVLCLSVTSKASSTTPSSPFHEKGTAIDQQSASH